MRRPVNYCPSKTIHPENHRRGKHLMGNRSQSPADHAAKSFVLSPGTIIASAKSVQRQFGMKHLFKFIIYRLTFHIRDKIDLFDSRAVTSPSAERTDIDIFFSRRIPVIKIKRLSSFPEFAMRHTLSFETDFIV